MNSGKVLKKMCSWCHVDCLAKKNKKMFGLVRVEKVFFPQKVQGKEEVAVNVKFMNT